MITPITSGTCSVYAKLPSGVVGKCMVTIQEDYKISLEYSRIKVLPNYTQKVKFTTVPAGANIKVMAQCEQLANKLQNASGGSYMSMGTEWMSYVDISVDNTSRTINIYGKQNCDVMVADLTLLFDEAGLKNNSSTHLQIFCENDVMCDAYNGKTGLQIFNNMSDIAFDHVEKGLYLDKKGETLLIRYYPQDLEIRVEPATNDAVKVGRVENSTYKDLEGIERYERRYQLIPLREKKAEPEDINIWWRLPGSQWSADRKTTARWTWTYKTYEPEITLKNATIAYDQTINGGWSRLNTNGDGSLQSITLGDGEELMFHFGVKNENAEGSVENVWLDEGIWGVGKGNKVKTNDATDKMDPSTWLSRRKTNGDYPDGFNDNGWLGSISNPHYDHWNKLPESKAELKKLKHLYCVAAEDDPGSWRIGHGWDFYVPDEFVWNYYNCSNQNCSNLKTPDGYVGHYTKDTLNFINYFKIDKDLIVSRTSDFNKQYEEKRFSNSGESIGRRPDSSYDSAIPINYKDYNIIKLYITNESTENPNLYWLRNWNSSEERDYYTLGFNGMHSYNTRTNWWLIGSRAPSCGATGSNNDYGPECLFDDKKKILEGCYYIEANRSVSKTDFNYRKVTETRHISGCQSYPLETVTYESGTTGITTSYNGYAVSCGYSNRNDSVLIRNGNLIWDNPYFVNQVDSLRGYDGQIGYLLYDSHSAEGWAWDEIGHQRHWKKEQLLYDYLKPAVDKKEHNNKDNETWNKLDTPSATLYVKYSTVEKELPVPILIEVHPNWSTKEKGLWKETNYGYYKPSN